MGTNTYDKYFSFEANRHMHFNSVFLLPFAQSAGAVEYTNCTSAEG